MLDDLQRLEDQVFSLVEMVEQLRSENQKLRQENHELQGRTQLESEKLKGILSLLESVETEKESASVSAPEEA